MINPKRIISMMLIIIVIPVVLSVPTYADSRDIYHVADIESTKPVLNADISGMCGLERNKKIWTLSGYALTNSEIMPCNIVNVNNEAFESEIVEVGALQNEDYITGNGSWEEPYEITNVEQLKSINHDLSGHYKLTQDLNLSEYNWMPIGDIDHPFTGFFDGNGHTIFNMTIDNTDITNAGLFGYCRESSVINLTLSDISIKLDMQGTDYEQTWDGVVYVGGICGYAYDVKSFTNCMVLGNISVINCNDAYVGGIVGSGSNINYCRSNTHIFINSNKNGRYVKGGTVFCGGIVGSTTTVFGEVKSCTNYGNIEVIADTYLYCGGINGYEGALSYCINYGVVTGKVTNASGHRSFAGHSNVGGIVGASSAEVKYCVNFGAISSLSTSTGHGVPNSSYAGGISGYIGYYGRGLVENCVNCGSVISSMLHTEYDIYNDSYPGNRARIANGSTIKDCYSLNTTELNDMELTSEDIGLNTQHGDTRNQDEIDNIVASFLKNIVYQDNTFYNGFLIGRDNNSYPHHNSAPNGGFVGRNDHSFTDYRFYNVLTEGLSKGKKKYILNRMSDPWQGSCYGVALSIALVYQGYASIHDITDSDATSYFNLTPRLDKDRKLSNMIEYYYLSQWINKGGKSAIDSQTYSNSFGLKDLVNNYSSLDYTLSRIVSKALDCNRNGGCFLLGYEYVDDDGEPGGHAVVVLGCQLISDGYNIIVYDENEREGILYDYLTIYKNNNKYTGFRFNHENVNSNNYKAIKVYDLESMKNTPVLSQKIKDIQVEVDEPEISNVFSIANDVTERILASNDVSGDNNTEEVEISFYGDSSFRMITSKGETLEYRGGELSGDIEVLSFYTYIANEKPLYSISVKSDNEYVIENIDSNLNIEILDDNNYYAVESDDIEKFSLDFENGLVLYGENYNFTAKIGIDVDDSTALLSLSGYSDKNLTVDISDSNLELKPNGSLNDIVVSVYDGTGKSESEYGHVDCDIIVDIDDISEKYPMLTSVEMFVARLYRKLLGREYESAGLEAWSDALVNNKTTGAKIVYKFVYSDEFQANPLKNDEFVTAMYETVFGREPDQIGLNAWVNVLENGCTRKKVLAGFLNSDEMKYLCDDIGVRDLLIWQSVDAA